MIHKSTYHIFLKNISNPLRIKIISCLKDKPRGVSELAQIIEEEQSKISHALASLKSCNIVENKQKGKQRIYFLNKRTILPILKLIDKHAQIFCGIKCKSCERVNQ